MRISARHSENGNRAWSRTKFIAEKRKLRLEFRVLLPGLPELKKLSSRMLDLFLLSVKAALSSLDARDEIANGNTRGPIILSIHSSSPEACTARSFDIGKVGQQSFRQEAEALAREYFVVKEEFNLTSISIS
jgi:hypothetical protein